MLYPCELSYVLQALAALFAPEPLSAPEACSSLFQWMSAFLLRYHTNYVAPSLVSSMPKRLFGDVKVPRRTEPCDFNILFSSHPALTLLCERMYGLMLSLSSLHGEEKLPPGVLASDHTVCQLLRL